MRTAILGGSFNPPHRGHLALISTVLDQGLADRGVLVPAAVPPHKRAPRQADPATRLAMARLLAEEDSRLGVDDIELHRTGPSYTIDTVRELMAKNPGMEYRLALGSDMAKSFATWRDYRELLRLSPPLSAERPDDRFAAAPDRSYPGMLETEQAVMEQGRFDMPPMPVSSTLVREKIAAGASDAELLAYVTPGVLRYIRDRRLYLD